MRKLLFIIFILIGFFASAQDLKPTDANLKTLQTPNNPILYYNTVTHKIGLWKGGYLYNEFFSAQQVQAKIDSIIGLGYKLFIDTVGFKGYFTNWDALRYRLLTNHDSLSTLQEKDYSSLTGKPNLTVYKLISDSTAAAGYTRRDRLASQIATRVPNVRTITTTAPLTIAGTTSADLSANRTIAISAATTGAAGSMSASDKTKLDGIATGATANVGTVTSIATGLGLTGGTITGTGTLLVDTTTIVSKVFSGNHYKLKNDSTANTGYSSRKRLASELAKKENNLTKGNLTESVTGLQFDNTRQVIGGAAILGMTSGYAIPTTTNISHGESGYDNQITSLAVTGTTTKTITLTQQDTGTVTTTFSVAQSDLGIVSATETATGIIPIATLVEVVTGTNDTKAITPLKLIDAIQLLSVPYINAIDDINLGTYSLIGDTINATGKLQINGVNVRNDWVADVITDAVTATAPSENAVYDALTLKLPINNPTVTGLLTTPSIKVTGFVNDGYVLKTDANGLIYTSALAAAQVYKGTWDGSSNTPTLANGTGTAGWYYRVVVAGTVNFGAGNITFAVGDDVSYDGSIWQKIPAATIIGNPLTKVDDTNMTLTLGGSPTTALVNAASLTLGWTGTLADSRITSATNWNAAYNDKINSLAFSGATTKLLTLTQQDGGTVTGTFTDNVDDADYDPAGEIQDLSGAGATLSGYVISLSSDATPVTLPNEADGNPSNELQSPTITGNLIGLTQTSTTIDISTATAVVANTAKVTNVTTNLSVSGTASPLTLNSSDGTDVTVTAGSGIGLAGTSGNITVTNTSPNVVQTSIVGITGTTAQFNTALTDADFATGGGTASGTNTGDNATNTQYSGLVTNATHIGDVAGTTTLTITTNAVTNAKAAQMVTKTYKGRTSAGTGNSEDVPIATLKADLSLTKSDVGLSNVPNLVFSGSNTGDQDLSGLVPKTTTITTTAPLTIDGITSANLSANRTLAINQSNATANGYLSNTDWNTFNNKQPGGNYLVAADISGKKDISDSTAITGYTRRDRLASELAKKQNKITLGTTSQYFKGDLSLGTFPTALSSFTNDLGNYGSYLVAADITGKKNISDSTAIAGYTRRDRLASELAKKENVFTKGNLTESVTGLQFDNTHQVIGGTAQLSLSSGYAIPTSTNISHGESGYDGRIATFTTNGNTGTSTFTANTVNIPNYTLNGLGGEPAFSKNTGFNKNFGSTIGTVLEGRTFGTIANSAIGDFVAYRTFGTAANNNTGDFEVPLTFSTGLSRIGNTISSTITQAVQSTTVSTGISELATLTESLIGRDTVRTITPLQIISTIKLLSLPYINATDDLYMGSYSIQTDTLIANTLIGTGTRLVGALPTGQLTPIAGGTYLTAEVDGNPFNEIQAPTLIANQLGLTSTSTTVDLSAYVNPTLPTDIYNEVVNETPNSVLTAFTIDNPATTGTVRVYLNGIRQLLTTQYSVTGATINFVSAPITGDIVITDYKY